METRFQLSESGRLVAYTIATVWVAKTIYGGLPRWFKRRGIADEEKDANDDLANPLVICKKIISMMKLCSDKVEDDLSWLNLQASFLTYLHLQKELRLTHPDYKDKRYIEGASKENVTKTELNDLLKYCRLAKWAYEGSYLDLHKNLKKSGYDLLRHDTVTEPGRVGHFVCVDHKAKIAVISVKGTSSLSDALTDVLGIVVEHDLPNPVESISKIKVHEGMYTAASMICEDTLHLVEHFFLPQGYTIKVVGHSLGAAVACILGLFLQSRVPATNYQNLRVLAFATPACLDIAIARAVAPFTTTVLNNTDCVPRLSVMNLVTLNKIFVKVDEALKAKGRSPVSWKGSRALAKDLMKVDDDLLITPEELHSYEVEIVKSMQQEKEDHSIFVPGRVVVLWESENSVKCATGDGGLHVLRHIEIETTMIQDHSLVKYLENLQKLLDQP